jgi:hypothetical protein
MMSHFTFRISHFALIFHLSFNNFSQCPMVNVKLMENDKWKMINPLWRAHGII